MPVSKVHVAGSIDITANSNPLVKRFEITKWLYPFNTNWGAHTADEYGNFLGNLAAQNF